MPKVIYWMLRDMEAIEEGRISDAGARILALAIKKKVRNLGVKIRGAQSLEDKIDLMSKQNSALAALVLTGISVGGDGLLSKAGILSGMFTEEDTPSKTSEN